MAQIQKERSLLGEKRCLQGGTVACKQEAAKWSPALMASSFQSMSQSAVWALTKGTVLALQRRQQSREKLPKIRKPGAQLGNKGIPQRPKVQWPDYKWRETLTVQKAGHWNIKFQEKSCHTGVQIPGPAKEKTLINH